mmetsp:Transcript_11928/g.18406  ORF Transcript_11928/g.18406 Transcript_11928/m.18406 type:complete len:121 (-) Transcript_11928:472-834(-)
MDIRGFIFYTKGNVRIQVTTTEWIYFYLIDPETFDPVLENVMKNYLNCSQMMFGSNVQECITYKFNQKSFDIHRRKCQHDIRVNVVKENFSGSWGLPVECINAFLVSHEDKIRFFDVNTY